MPAIGGKNVTTWTARDATKEPTTHDVYTGEITAVSLPGLLTQLGAYETAWENIILGQRYRRSWGEQTVISNVIPSNPAAQREAKLEVQYWDVVTQEPFTLTIGTIDFSVLVFMPGAGDAVAFQEEYGASDQIIAWVTAFEAMAKSPRNEANAVEVTGMKFIGVNS